MKKSLLFMTLAVLAVSACNIPHKRSDDTQLATEISMASTSIRETVEAGWTETPLPVTPTPESSQTPTVSLFIDPVQVIDPDAELTAMTEPYPTASAEVQQTPIPVETRVAGHFQTRTPLPGPPTPDYRPLAENWRQWPIVPEVSDTAADIYWYGVKELGTDPHYLSRIGDCHSEPGVFMGIYDTDFYSLSDEDQYLTDAIEFFRGSFDRTSYSVHAGMSAASVMTSIWADPTSCNDGETALDCEIRINNPSIMFVNLGSNWIPGAGTDIYYDYLCDIVRTLLDHGILPILTSKADNVEGDYSINEITAQVAREFDLPFFNFWAAAQYIPNNGLDPEKDGIHLSVEAWNWRNYYALRTLYNVGKKLELF